MLTKLVLALALSATVIPQTVEQLTDRATHVVRAKVLAQKAAREEGPAVFYTRSTLRIREALKGPLAESLVLRQAGGTIGTEKVELVGDAKLAIGEEVLVFLHCERGADHCSLIGLSQGKYHLEKDASGAVSASRNFDKTEFVAGDPLSSAPEPYEALAKRIRAHVKEAR